MYVLPFMILQKSIAQPTANLKYNCLANLTQLGRNCQILNDLGRVLS